MTVPPAIPDKLEQYSPSSIPRTKTQLVPRFESIHGKVSFCPAGPGKGTSATHLALLCALTTHLECLPSFHAVFREGSGRQRKILTLTAMFSFGWERYAVSAATVFAEIRPDTKVASTPCSRVNPRCAKGLNTGCPSGLTVFMKAVIIYELGDRSIRLKINSFLTKIGVKC